MQIIAPSEISADNSACVWTNVRDFQIATMSGDLRGPELKSIMAKTELVVEVGLKLAVYEDFVYFPFQFFRMTVSLFIKSPGSDFEVLLKTFKRLHPN